MMSWALHSLLLLGMALFANFGKSYATVDILTSRSLQVENVVIPISLNQPINAVVGAGAIRYFSINVPIPFSTVHITATPQYGDVSLFVSPSLTNSAPTFGNSSYLSRSPFGIETIDIFAADRAVLNVCYRDSREGSSCEFIIGVEALDSSQFVLKALLDNSVSSLILNTPIVDKVAPGSYSTYVIPFQSSRTLFSLTTFSGDLSMYIGCSSQGQVNPRGDVPSSYCASYVGQSDSSSTSIAPAELVVPGFANECACDGGNLYVAVTNVASEYSQFSLLASSADNVLAAMLNGVPLTIASPRLPLSVEAELRASSAALPTTSVNLYFDFIPGSHGVSVYFTQFIRTSVNFAVTVFGVVGTGSTPLTTVSSANAHFNFTLTNGLGQYHIPASSSFLQTQCPSTTEVCRLQLSTTLLSGDRAVVINRASHGESLQDNVPVTRRSPVSELKYFTYTHTEFSSPLSISVTPVSGLVDVFVAAGRLPTRDSYDFRLLSHSTNMSESVSTLVITPAQSPQSCVGACTYYIAVVPSVIHNAPATFTILSKARYFNAAPLAIGSTLTDSTSQSETNYYILSLPVGSAPVSASLTVVSGSATLSYGPSNVSSQASPGQIGLPSPLTYSSELVGTGASTVVVLARNSTSGAGCIASAPLTEVVTENVTIVENVTSYETVEVQVDENTTEWQTVEVVREVTRVETRVHNHVRTVTWETPCSLKLSVSSQGRSATYLLSVTDSAFTRALLPHFPLSTLVSSRNRLIADFSLPVGCQNATVSMLDLFGVSVGMISSPNGFSQRLGGISPQTAVLPACPSGRDLEFPCQYSLSVTPSDVDSDDEQSVVTRYSIPRIELRTSDTIALRVGAARAVRIVEPVLAVLSVPSIVGPEETMSILVNSISGGFVSMRALPVDVSLYSGASLPFPLSSAAQPGLLTPTYVEETLTELTFPAAAVAGKTLLLVLEASGPADTVVRVSRSSLPTALVNGVPRTLRLAAPALSTTLTLSVPKDLVRAANAAAVLHLTPLSGSSVVSLTVAASLQALSSGSSSNVFVAGLPESYRIFLSAGTLQSMCFPSEQLPPQPLEETLVDNGSVEDCVLFLRASAPASATFSLAMSAASADSFAMGGVFSRLRPSVPSFGSVAAGERALFFVDPRDASTGLASLGVSELNADGDVTLLVKLEDDDEDDDAFEFPTATDFDIRVAVRAAPETVLLNPEADQSPADDSEESEPEQQQPAQSKRILIALLGNAPSVSVFSLLYSPVGAVAALPVGAPVEIAVPRTQSVYFSVPLTKEMIDSQAALSVQVTALAGRVRTLSAPWFPSADVPSPAALAARPSSALASSFQFVSSTGGALLISPQSRNYCSSACTYIFAVESTSGSAASVQVSYTASVTVNDVPPSPEDLPSIPEISPGPIDSADVPVVPDVPRILQTPVVGEMSALSFGRIIAGVPSGGAVRPGQYQYFLLDAGFAAGNVTIDITHELVSQRATAILLVGTYPNIPVITDSSTYFARSGVHAPSLRFLQGQVTAFSGSAGATASRRQYVVAVYAPTLPESELDRYNAALPQINFNLWVDAPTGSGSSSYQTVSVLTPGLPAPRSTLQRGETRSFWFQLADATRDTILHLSMFSGDAQLTLTPPARLPPVNASLVVSPCVRFPVGGGPATRQDCAAVWGVNTTLQAGFAQLIVRSDTPCAAASAVLPHAQQNAAPGVRCTSGLYVPGAYLVSVTALSSRAEFEVSADSAGGSIRVRDAQPRQVLQRADGESLSFVYEASEASSLHPNLRVVMQPAADSAPFTAFLNSCRSSDCNYDHVFPGSYPKEFLRRDSWRAGSAPLSFVLEGTTPGVCRASTASHQASNDADLRGDCRYFLSFEPDVARCSAMKISPCVARVALTITDLDGHATSLVPLHTTRDRRTTIPVFSSPATDLGVLETVEFAISAGPSADGSSQDLGVKIAVEACDTLGGLAPVASVCAVGSSRYLSCSNSFYPSPEDSSFTLDARARGLAEAWNPQETATSYVVSVRRTPIYSLNGTLQAPVEPPQKLLAAGFGTPEMQFHLSLNAPVLLTAQEAAQASTGLAFPSQIPQGSQIPDEPATQSIFITRRSNTEASLTFNPAMLRLAGQTVPAPAGLVEYVVVYAPESFSKFLEQLTNLTARDLAIVSSTACGVRRVGAMLSYFQAAAIAAGNVSVVPVIVPAGTTQVQLKDLQPGVEYKAAVLASCNSTCVAAAFALLGVNDPATRPHAAPHATNEVLLGQVYFRLHQDGPAHPVSAPVSTVILFFGFAVLLVLGGYAFVRAFRRSDADAASLNALEAAKVRVRGVFGKTVEVNTSSKFFFGSRSLKPDHVVLSPNVAVEMGESPLPQVVAKDKVAVVEERIASKRIAERIAAKSQDAPVSIPPPSVHTENPLFAGQNDVSDEVPLKSSLKSSAVSTTSSLDDPTKALLPLVAAPSPLVVAAALPAIVAAPVASVLPHKVEEEKQTQSLLESSFAHSNVEDAYAPISVVNPIVNPIATPVKAAADYIDADTPASFASPSPALPPTPTTFIHVDESANGFSVPAGGADDSVSAYFSSIAAAPGAVLSADIEAVNEEELNGDMITTGYGDEFADDVDPFAPSDSAFDNNAIFG